MYAGIADVKLSSVILSSVTPLNIRNPTMISAGAVANDGIDTKIGASNVETRKSIAVVSAVSPVLPPAPTPAADSTKVVVVDVPNTAPEAVATASAISAGLIPGSLPSSSNMSAFEATPISVPSVSKRSTKRNEKITTIKLNIPTPFKSTLKHWPNVSPSFVKSVIVKLGISE